LCGDYAYTKLVSVKVGVRELRANLRAYLDRVQAGEDVIVTERGVPIAKITNGEAERRRQELIDRGILRPASKPWRRINVDELPELKGEGPTLSEILLEQRRSARY
jgi:prevent-host-death family protein